MMKSEIKKHLDVTAPKHRLRQRLHHIIFDADTPAAKLFDILLFIAIVLSVAGMMLESVGPFNAKFRFELQLLDWVLTILFTIEYVLRIWTTGKPWKYIFSFYGIVDLLAILPTYIAFFISGAHTLSIIRAIRLIRIFRVLKLVQFVGEANNLAKSLKASASKIIVFLFFIFIVCIIVGTMMFLIEGGENGFTSIPRSIYWAVVTLSTVGYGDISPGTPLGQFLAMILMILGYSVIALPTGLVTAGVIKNSDKKEVERIASTKSCPECNAIGHLDGAEFCYTCGSKL